MPLTPLPIDPDVTKMTCKTLDGDPLTFTAALRQACDQDPEPERDGDRNHARNVVGKMARAAWHRALSLEAIAERKCARCPLVLMSPRERTSGLCDMCIEEIRLVHLARALNNVYGAAVTR